MKNKKGYIIFTIWYGLLIWFLTGGGGVNMQTAFTDSGNLISYLLGISLFSFLFLFLLPYFIAFLINKMAKDKKDEPNLEKEDNLFKTLYFTFMIGYTFMLIKNLL